jgi:hypothetical protein
VQKNKVNNNDEEYIRQVEKEHKPPFNKGQLGTGSPRSVLSNFIKVGPAARQWSINSLSSNYIAALINVIR